MERPLISQKAYNVLAVLGKGKRDREYIAEALDITMSSVNGTLTGLRNNGLVDIDANGKVAATAAAKPYLAKKGQEGVKVVGGPRKQRTGTKMEQARLLFDRYHDKGRPAVLEHFRDIGLTERGASTYYQNIRRERGMSNPITGEQPKRANAR